jgi:3-methyladenine DNA glycosylase AlkD
MPRTKASQRPGNADDVAVTAAEICARSRSEKSLTAASMRAVRREFSKRVASWPAGDVVALGFRLLDEPGVFCRFVAYELIACHRDALRSLKAKDLTRLGRGLDSWAAVDCFACYLAGAAWRERQVPDSLIHRWARSPDRWWRRAALVCTVPLNTKAQGGTGDPDRTTAVCKLLVADRDDMVVKALSWALRALVPRDADSVRMFLADYDDVLAARVIREVGHKLETGRKNPRKT